MMARRARLLSRASLVLAACLWTSALPAADASSENVAVVVHAGVPVDNLSLAELRRVLLGDRQFWTPSLRVTLLIRAPRAHERDVLLRRVYQMSEAQFRQYWIAKVFRAETATGPKIIYSNQTATELVADIPGAIAFVAATQIPRGLKVLRIDGHLPGARGYPLR